MQELREKVVELERAVELADKIEKVIEILEILRKSVSIRMEKYETEESKAYWTGIFDALDTVKKLLAKIKAKQPNNTYEYEETPIKCQECNARYFGIVKNFAHKRRIVYFVCPVCEQELHYALLSLTGQIER